MVNKAKIDQVKAELKKNKLKDKMFIENEPQKSGCPEKAIKPTTNKELNNGKGKGQGKSQRQS
ncbi:hypothetical protein [Microbulbifer spongiae]|uniref:Uncharacterized protein n=1 Tax=Microbulbifer spongiae TaxID=2944933 RepID=A0ABY9E852_9GAMM|nr:hypothetical protein [Microbulbifer sp. MI-G]WKD48322.1 hypothetical protein M8T91_10285 [Microbulbifer sp. MI-G]